MSIGPMVTGGRTKGTAKRDPLDFDPTPPEATAAFAIAERGALAGRGVWEPACGDGRMVDELARHGIKIVAASDVEDRANGRFTVANFLTSPLPPGCDAIITNPPFNQAEKFIRHALGELQVPYLALLLKATYWHSDKRTGLWDRFTPTALMPICWRLDFRQQGNPVMDCQWVVWDRSAAGTIRTQLLRQPRPMPAMADLLEVNP